MGESLRDAEWVDRVLDLVRGSGLHPGGVASTSSG
jgi:hypothetical protein